MYLFFNEPQFFPPLEFFYGLINSDIWVVVDHLPYQSRTRQNRCRIKTSTGVSLLSVSIQFARKPMCEIVINNYTPWKQNFINAIQRNYADAPYYQIYFDTLKQYILGPTILLETFNVQTTLWIAGLLKASPTLIYTYHHYRHYPKQKVIEAVCHKLGGCLFEKPFSHPYYKQASISFEKDLSVLDALFCIGAGKTRELLTNG